MFERKKANHHTREPNRKTDRYNLLDRIVDISKSQYEKQRHHQLQNGFHFKFRLHNGTMCTMHNTDTHRHIHSLANETFYLTFVFLIFSAIPWIHIFSVALIKAHSTFAIVHLNNKSMNSFISMLHECCFCCYSAQTTDCNEFAVFFWHWCNIYIQCKVSVFID